MNLLLLTLYYAPDISANAVILTQLAEELAARGHCVTVITSLPHYETGRIAEGYRGRLWAREQRNGVDIWHVPLWVPRSKREVGGRGAYYLSFHAASTFAALLAPPADLILAPSPPLTIGLSAWFAARCRRIPFVYNVQDIWPDALARLGLLTNPAAIAQAHRLEQFVYRKAARVVVISEGFARNLAAKGVPREKVAVIPNFVDTDWVRPLPRENEWARAQGLAGRFMVLFAGNLGYSQALDRVVETAARLRDLPDLLFLLVGHGAAQEALAKQTQSLGLDNMRFLPFQPAEKVPEMYAAAEVCLVTLRRGMGEVSVPSKLWTIMAAGRPVLASLDAESDAAQAVRDSGGGVCVPPEDPAALEAELRALYAAPARRAEMGQRGRNYVETHLSKRLIADRYQTLLSQTARK